MGHIASTYRVKWGQDKLWDLPLPNQKGPKGIQELIQIRRSIGPPSSQDLYIYYTLHTHTHTHTHTQSSLVAQMVKNLPPVQETWEPWVRKIPWRREWQSTPVFLPGEFHGQRSLVGYSPWGPKESDMTELTHTSFLPGDGNVWKHFQLSQSKGERCNWCPVGGGPWRC